MIARVKSGHRYNEARTLRLSARDKLSMGDYLKSRDDYKLAVMLEPAMLSDVLLDYERKLEGDGGNIALRLSLADLFLKFGDLDAALVELEEILDLAPDLESVYNILGRILMSRGAVNETIQLLERALKRGLRSTALSEILAGAYLESGNIDRSIKLYEELLELAPAEKKTLRILADLYARVSQNESSAKMYVNLYEADPGSYPEIVHKLESLAKLKKDSQKIREMLAEIYIKGHEPGKAVDQFRQIFSVDRFKTGEAISKYKKALDMYPGHPGLICSLAEALIFRGSYTEAATEYNKLTKLGPEYVDMAIQGFLKIAKSYPDNVLAHRFLGDAYEALGKHDDALQEYRTVLSLDPKEAEYITRKCREILKARPDLISLHQVLGEVFLLKKDYKKVVSEAEEILAVDGQNIDAFILLGDGYRGLKMNSKASNSYAMALGLEPFNISVQRKLEASRKADAEESIKFLKGRIKEDQWRKSLHLDLAKQYLELKDWEGATRELQEAIRDQSRAPFAYNLLGLSLKEQGKFELAQSQFKKAIEILPDELGELEKTIKFNLASTFEALGRVDEAMSTYESIREKDIKFGNVESRIKGLTSINPRALKDRMFVLVLQDAGEKALLELWGRDGRRAQHGRRADEFGISFAQTHNEAGFEHLVKGRYRSAEDEFLLASSLDARLPSALNNLAVVYARQKRLDDAETKISAALEQDPKHAVLHNNRGVIAYLKGDSKSAEVEFLRALSIDPELDVACINLGDAYYSQGNARQALAYWEKVKNYTIVSELADRRLRFKVPNYQ